MANKLKDTVNKLQYLLKMTVEEVAMSIGYSRVHLTKQMNKKKDDDVTNSLNSLLEDKHKGTLQNVSNEDQEDYITAKNTDVGKVLGRLLERQIYNSASISVLEQMVEKVVSDHTGKSIALVSGERKKAVQMESDRLFDEQRKKLKQG